MLLACTCMEQAHNTRRLHIGWRERKILDNHSLEGVWRYLRTNGQEYIPSCLSYFLTITNIPLEGGGTEKKKMQEEENINFESMNTLPSFDFNKVKQVDDKVYISLLEELEEKCNPELFLNAGYDRKRFEVVNSIYGELKQRGVAKDEELTDLRNRAIDELGIHFSTKKKYDYLLKYIDPKIYIAMQPYDAARVAQAEQYYNRLNEDRRDIRALEQLEQEAQAFIARKNTEELEEAERRELEEKKEAERRKLEKKEEAEKRKKEDITSGIVLLALIVIIIIAVSFGKL